MSLSYNDIHFFVSKNSQTGKPGLVSFTACPSGLAYTYNSQNAMMDRGCSICEEGYYSFGWNSECTECSLLDRTQTDYYFETNLIDNICFEDNTLVQVVKAIINAEPKSLAALFITLGGILLVVIAVTVTLYLTGKCCACCYRKSLCCLPRNSSKDDKKP